jgi:dihydrofolate synthase/folylpolyglutamate synthase
MFSAYSEAIAWLQSQLPTFHLQGKTAFNPSLEIITHLAEFLGNPHLKYPTVHIAGTNGKGSVASMLASVLQESGYKTALYTSPHLLSFTERIKINEKTIPESEILYWVNVLYPVVQKMSKKPSFFEITTAIAFAYFAEQKVDIAVIETGLGGRLDATNIVKPVVSAITRINYDHTDILGDTLAKIAAEKAGIIKPNTPIFVGKKHEETDSVFTNIAKYHQSPLFFVEDSWKSIYQNADFLHSIHDVYFGQECIYPQVKVGLLGKYQSDNVAVVCAICDFLADNQWNIKDIHLYRGFQNVQKNVNLMGRMQVISQNPLMIADIAHNTEGIQAVLESLSHFERIHAVLGILQDKDAKSMIRLFPKNTLFYMITADTPRAVSNTTLAQIAKDAGYTAQAYSSMEEAILQAQTGCKDDEVVYAGGSNYVVSMVLKKYL